MQLGMIGLGRMGSNLVRRLLADGEHDCVVYDRDVNAAKSLTEQGRPRPVPRRTWSASSPPPVPCG